MKKALGVVVAVVTLGVAFPTAGISQTASGGGWWDWALPEIAGGEDVRTTRGRITIPWPGGDRYEDRGRRGDKGPPFCRNGEGHPVHGRRWCAEKGFGRHSGWRRVGWEDIVLRAPRRYDESLRRGTLIDILGDVEFGRLESAGRRSGDGPLVGRWMRPDRERGGVLQIRAGSVPLAELTDLDGDGRVDALLLRDGD